MESSLYSARKYFSVKKQFFSDDETSLHLLLRRSHFTAEEITKAVIVSLKQLLAEGDLKSFIEQLLELESDLVLLNKRDEFVGISDELSDFYRGLAPMLLRVIWEQLSFNDSAPELLHELLTSLRVAVEEELFYWQQKRKSVDI